MRTGLGRSKCETLAGCPGGKLEIQSSELRKESRPERTEQGSGRYSHTRV